MNRKNLTRRHFMLRLGMLTSVLGGVVSPTALAATNPTGRLSGVKSIGSGGQFVISFSLDTPIKYKTFTLKEPDRIVVDLLNTSVAGTLNMPSQALIRGMRSAEREGGDLRIVFDMVQTVTAEPALVGNELRLSVKALGEVKTTKPPARLDAVTAAAAAAPRVMTPPAPTRQKFTVVIDPGHGGHDPGAISTDGIKEKDVVLQVARKLKNYLDRAPNMRAVLTRDSDVYIPLRKRMDIAHEQGADLFISVHADSYQNPTVSGSSVYILSDNGASSEAARLMAESENSYDVKFGSVGINDTSERIASVLLDLSQNDTIDKSLDFAKGALHELAKITTPLRQKVESAGFMVLKSPDIPSMLVETAFLSNPTDARRLTTDSYQQSLAGALFRGIKRYQMVHGYQGNDDMAIASDGILDS